MIKSLPCIIDKMTLKPPSKSPALQETRACRPHGPNSTLCCPEVHWLWPSETVPVDVCLIWRLLDKHSYISLASSTFSTALWPLSIRSALSRPRQESCNKVEANLSYKSRFCFKMGTGITSFSGYLRKKEKTSSLLHLLVVCFLSPPPTLLMQNWQIYTFKCHGLINVGIRNDYYNHLSAYIISIPFMVFCSSFNYLTWSFAVIIFIMNFANMCKTLSNLSFKDFLMCESACRHV